MSLNFVPEVPRSVTRRRRSGNVNHCERITLYFNNMAIVIYYVVFRLIKVKGFPVPGKKGGSENIMA